MNKRVHCGVHDAEGILIMFQSILSISKFSCNKKLQNGKQP